MLVMNTETKYGGMTKLLHWTIALLFLVQFLLVYWKGNFLPDKSPIAKFLIVNLHEPIGITVLFLGILAIAWRIINIKPVFPPTMPNWEKYSANSVHILLYLTMIIMPVSGVLMAVAAGHPPNYFGFYQIPAFMAENKSLSDFLFQIHETTAVIIVILVSLHTLAALKHHFINRDMVLRRML